MNNKLGILALILGFIFLKADLLSNKFLDKTLSEKEKSFFQLLAIITFVMAIIFSFK